MIYWLSDTGVFKYTCNTLDWPAFAVQEWRTRFFNPANNPWRR